MTYPLGCFPSAFLGCEMEEQKAALEKGIYNLIVGWSRMVPVLGLDASYGSFAIWDSLRFCNNPMAQPEYSTPEFCPKGPQDSACRTWRHTFPVTSSQEHQTLPKDLETFNRNECTEEPTHRDIPARGRTCRKAAAEGRDGHSDFSVGEVIIFSAALIAVQEMLQGKRWRLTWNETSGPWLHRTLRSGRPRARVPHSPLPTAVRTPRTEAPRARYTRYSRCPAARRSTARHSMAKSPRTGGAVPNSRHRPTRQTHLRSLIGQQLRAAPPSLRSDWRWKKGGVPRPRPHRGLLRGGGAGSAVCAGGRARGCRWAVVAGGRPRTRVGRPRGSRWGRAWSRSWRTRGMASRSWTPTPPLWSWTRVRTGAEGARGWGVGRGPAGAAVALSFAVLCVGLRSGKLGEQCEAVVRFPRLFQKYPFPILINSAFLKLADVFRVGWVACFNSAGAVLHRCLQSRS